MDIDQKYAPNQSDATIKIEKNNFQNNIPNEVLPATTTDGIKKHENYSNSDANMIAHSMNDIENKIPNHV